MTNTRLLTLGIALLGVALFISNQAVAQEHGEKKHDHGHEHKHGDAHADEHQHGHEHGVGQKGEHGHEHAGGPEMDPARMAEMMKLMMPNEHHHKMKSLAGNWDLTVKMFMPGAPPTESKATSKAELIMGGRYLLDRVEGSFMGMPFEGMSLMGFDNHKKVYTSHWIDNMGTYALTSTGTCDDSGKVYTFTGVSYDPMSGRDAKFRQVMNVINDNKYTHEMFMINPDGQETKAMEILATRQTETPRAKGHK